MDKFKIDSHKLVYHPARVASWLSGKNIYPIYAEISPSGACNHRCVYCALDFMEYKPRFLDAKVLKTRLAEMARLGLGSVMFAGEGEPFLHKDMAEINAYAKKCGVDTAYTTNGVLLTPTIADRIVKDTSWIKVSINGGNKKTYAAIHRTREDDYIRVMENMRYADKLRKRKKYKCVLGMQMVLLPENVNEAEALARQAKAIGMDYLVIKPFSQHPQSIAHKYGGIAYSRYEKMAERLAKISGSEFSVVFRINTMRKWDAKHKPYKECCALPFWTYIDAGGNVWGCSMFLGKKEFYYGNIYENSFRQIWVGEKRRQSLAMVHSKLDPSKCRVNCRMDEINRYLWELKNPPAHVNFI